MHEDRSRKPRRCAVAAACERVLAAARWCGVPLEAADAAGWARVPDAVWCTLFEVAFCLDRVEDQERHHRELLATLEATVRPIVRRPALLFPAFYDLAQRLPQDRHGRLLHALRHALGGTYWAWGPAPPAAGPDPRQAELWTVAPHSRVFLCVQITDDPDASHAWTGRWPLPQGATYAVFLRVNPMAYERGGRSRDPGLRQRVALVRRRVHRLLRHPGATAATCGGGGGDHRVFEVHRLFFGDEPTRAPAEPGEDPTERIVYRPGDVLW